MTEIDCWKDPDASPEDDTKPSQPPSQHAPDPASAAAPVTSAPVVPHQCDLRSLQCMTLLPAATESHGELSDSQKVNLRLEEIRRSCSNEDPDASTSSEDDTVPSPPPSDSPSVNQRLEEIRRLVLCATDSTQQPAGGEGQGKEGCKVLADTSRTPPPQAPASAQCTSPERSNVLVRGASFRDRLKSENNKFVSGSGQEHLTRTKSLPDHWCPRTPPHQAPASAQSTSPERSNVLVRGASFRDRFKSDNDEFVTSVVENSQDRLKELNSALLEVQRTLLALPKSQKKARTDAKLEALALEEKLLQYNSPCSFAEEAAVYAAPENSQGLQPLNRGIGACSPATVSGQRNFSSPEAFADWLSGQPKELNHLDAPVTESFELPQLQNVQLTPQFAPYMGETSALEEKLSI